MSQIYNTWFPWDQSYVFGSATSSVGESPYKAAMITSRKVILSGSDSGFGFTFDMISPVLNITKPPKVMYRSESDLMIVIKDAAGWNWEAKMRAHPEMAERGWSWNKFILSATQENVSDDFPAEPTVGPIKHIQFKGQDSAVYPVSFDLAYIAGRTPENADSGEARSFSITLKDNGAYTWKVGDAQMEGATRRPIRYLGAAPFALQIDGPRGRGDARPYRGPIVMGYQSGTPWVHLGNNEALGNMLDAVLESQNQFKLKHPDAIFGPFAHIYVQATWDAIQSGEPDTWVWDGPDGNPAWSGWQFRCFDAMSRTWYEAEKKGGIAAVNRNKLRTICMNFLEWMYDWMVVHPEADYIPSDWSPPGWSRGIPLDADSYLDPHGTEKNSHDVALVLKGALHCYITAPAISDRAMAAGVIKRCFRALRTMQYLDDESPMSGAFTTDPDHFVVFGFHQGEVLEALALLSRVLNGELKWLRGV